MQRTLADCLSGPARLARVTNNNSLFRMWLLVSARSTVDTGEPDGTLFYRFIRALASMELSLSRRHEAGIHSYSVQTSVFKHPSQMARRCDEYRNVCSIKGWMGAFVPGDGAAKRPAHQ